ncbi:MAG: fatty acid kinase fatty acid binding subunit [Thermoanaerobacteraceae bacterium]|uniref:DegV family EDD domain-containing protein n=1 Tax=Biomaibacter acetigenes TaxID=2316383 RepID=A0A3G2R5Q2_9FIRM|nr:DegV family protein [Biomaibacter acetigenes]MDK2879138.1 fatty acid kinase fatty acid binding subunit [Thermoanaerobacteraceae bacterium]RKL62879.1 DegV family protein [Thermoanaerobacteraceae bacterium SP2]AYO30428.1 DegV family EDD domain-containing protein [Biomaibacter acetigenes]MDN5300599.1 fatty acid kinase fatty acid binding subunit [Thermoanaerobacteraceae bacterium]MDN5312494.1 fatty acid kinase fatty acid binding subunit [Thermoanaerobacteraceae bacterium]
MGNISIVTDSTADLSPELLEKYNITVVPLKIFFGDEEFHEGVDITPAQFYDKLRTSPHHPRTSQPSPAEFAACYEKLSQKADHIISIHLSSKLSGTYQSAVLAKDMVKVPVDVIDSKGASMMIGFTVLEAAKAAKEGRDRQSILHLIDDMIRKIKVYFVVDTLDYLQKGGRIGKASAFLGNLLNIKPMLTIKDGLVAPVEKIRGKARVLDKLLEKVSMDASNVPLTGTVIHASCKDEAERYKEIFEKHFNFKELTISTIGAVIGTYTGPGTIGIIYY